MTYVTSNLYGDLSLWQRLLQAINFSDRDVLYVLGDTVDFGEESMELLTDMSMRVNVLPVAGNHDLEALRMLTSFDKLLKTGDAPTPDFAAEMMAWAKDGGQATLTGFRALDADMREGVLDYLSEFALFEEIEIKGKQYVLTHGGIQDYSPDTALEDYEPNAFFAGDHSSLPALAGKILVAGDVATADGRISRTDSVICLGNKDKEGSVACLCLENGQEYYV